MLKVGSSSKPEESRTVLLTVFGSSSCGGKAPSRNGPNVQLLQKLSRWYSNLFFSRRSLRLCGGYPSAAAFGRCVFQRRNL